MVRKKSREGRGHKDERGQEREGLAQEREREEIRRGMRHNDI
jgi:hypothetical protein